jgi:anti-sigma factor RsiW
VDHQSAVERNLTEHYVLGELSPEEAEEFEEHFFDCEICAEDVRQASRARANLKEVLREKGTDPAQD